MKAILLFSGGLDSILAVKILREQKVRVFPVFFKSYFFGPEIALKSARNLNLKLRIFDFSKEHLEIVKRPKFGWGKGMNPCLDCKILMLKKAKEIMKEIGADFVATGEVVGERPFSQKMSRLSLIEKESSLKGYLLRPLSAKLLEPTHLEKKGLIKREALFDIQGRRRVRQIELAKKFKITFYPSPSGGCILTDLEFSKKLKELLESYPEFQEDDVELLKLGRHPSLLKKEGVKIVIGRNEKENERLKKLAKKGDILIEIINYPSPLTLIRPYRGKIKKEIIEKAKSLTKYYAKKAREKKDIKFEVICI